MDLASAEAEIRHVFGDTLITEASIGAAPPDILVKLSGRTRANDIIIMPNIISTDEDPSLRIDRFVIINLRSVSTKLYFNLIFTMQTY